MAVSTEPSIFFSKRELNQISRVFRKMDDAAKNDAKRKIQELVGKQLSSIRASQPEIIKEFEEIISDIAKDWSSGS